MYAGSRSVSVMSQGDKRQAKPLRKPNLDPPLDEKEKEKIQQAFIKKLAKGGKDEIEAWRELDAKNPNLPRSRMLRAMSGVSNPDSPDNPDESYIHQ